MERAERVEQSASKRKLMVVEDDRNLLEFLEHVLSAHFKVSGFACGRAALRGLRSNPPEALVTDLELPRFPGEQLARAAGALPDPPRVVLMSGDYDRLTRARPLGHAVLQKPFSPRRLLDALGTRSW
jgi:DNA-binding response OmpR family regulator